MFKNNSTKASILILLSHFSPGSKMGGPLSSVKNLLNLLYGSFDFRIVTSNHDLKSKNPYSNVASGKWTLFQEYLVFYISNYYQMIIVLYKSECDLILLNSFFHPIFSILPVVLKKVKFIRIPVIIAPRGELFEASLKFKKNKKKLYIWIFILFRLDKGLFWQVSSEIEKKSLMKNLNIKEKSIFILPNVIIPKGKIHLSDVEVLSNSGSLRIVYFSRISKDKNILYTLDVLCRVERHVVYDIYGPIEDLYIWNEFLIKSDSLPNNITVHYHGEYSGVSKNLVLSNYDLFFLPTFSENFGNAIVESLIAGTKVLISDRTPWRELSSKGLGWDLSLSDLSTFVGVIENFEMARGTSTIKEKALVRETFISSYFNENQKESHLEAYSMVIQSN